MKYCIFANLIHKIHVLWTAAAITIFTDRLLITLLHAVADVFLFHDWQAGSIHWLLRSTIERIAGRLEFCQPSYWRGHMSLFFWKDLLGSSISTLSKLYGLLKCWIQNPQIFSVGASIEVWFCHRSLCYFLGTLFQLHDDGNDLWEMLMTALKVADNI